MSFLSDRFYDLRASHMGFASKDNVKKAASDPRVVFLDVRSKAEIANASLKTDKPVVHAECGALDDCTALDQLPKKKDSPIIVFCASGKRASNAKQILNSRGYVNVLNAGGLGDLEYL